MKRVAMRWICPTSVVAVAVSLGSLSCSASALADSAPSGAATEPPQIETCPGPITAGGGGGRLCGTIDPNGVETTYHFEFGPTSSYGTDIPVPDADAGSGPDPIPVSEQVTGLQPGTTYHYRLAATTSNGTSFSEDGELSSAAEAPAIESESVSRITATDATLEAQLNSEGLETSYEFHLQRRWPCEEVDPRCYPPVYFLKLPSGELLGSLVGQSVSLDLNSAGVSLAPAAKYEYWLTAGNTAGTATGSIQTFTTPPSSPPSIESESASDVRENDATVEAEINPNGAYTAYEFQIAASSDYNYPHMVCPLSLPGFVQCDAISGDESLPPGLIREPGQASIPADAGPQSVSLDLADIGATLQPDTTYHYRVIAANITDGATIVGTDQTFTTSSSGGAPKRDQSKGPGGGPPLLDSPPATSTANHKGHRHRGHRHRRHRAQQRS